MLCDKTKKYTADILIPQERAIILVFRHQQWLVADAALVLNMRSNDSTLQNAPTSTDFCLYPVLYQVLNKQVPIPVPLVVQVRVPVPNLQVQVPLPVLGINYRIGTYQLHCTK